MKTEEQAAMIYTAILECFKEESELPLHMDIGDLRENFFEAGVMAFNLLYRRITNEELDTIAFIGVLNKICVQGLLGAKEEETE